MWNRALKSSAPVWTRTPTEHCDDLSRGPVSPNRGHLFSYLCPPLDRDSLDGRDNVSVLLIITSQCKRESSAQGDILKNICGLTGRMKVTLILASVAQLVVVLSHIPKSCRFHSQSGHMLGLWIWSPVRFCMEGDQSMFLSHHFFSPSLSLPPFPSL